MAVMRPSKPAWLDDCLARARAEACEELLDMFGATTLEDVRAKVADSKRLDESIAEHRRATADAEAKTARLDAEIAEAARLLPTDWRTTKEESNESK
jgi:hypothetical protein